MHSLEQHNVQVSNSLLPVNPQDDVVRSDEDSTDAGAIGSAAETTGGGGASYSLSRNSFLSANM